VPVFGDKDVSWLDVAMNNALGVRCIQSAGNFDSERQNQFGFQRTPRDPVLSVIPSRNSMAMKVRPCWSSIS